jgi:hypothetical protein
MPKHALNLKHHDRRLKAYKYEKIEGLKLLFLYVKGMDIDNTVSIGSRLWND